MARITQAPRRQDCRSARPGGLSASRAPLPKADESGIEHACGEPRIERTAQTKIAAEAPAGKRDAFRIHVRKVDGKQAAVSPGATRCIVVMHSPKSAPPW